MTPEEQITKDHEEEDARKHFNHERSLTQQELKKNIKEFKKEISSTNPKFPDQRRKLYLKNLKIQTQSAIDSYLAKAETIEEDYMQDLYVEMMGIRKLIKKLQSIDWQLTNMYGSKKTLSENWVSEEEIKRAKEVDIVEMGIIEGRASNRGKYYSLACIFHEEKTASMHIYKEGKGYYCFGCHKGGSVIDVVMEIQGIKFNEAVKLLIGR